ncbi:MAG: ComEA family DNA-binding protein [Anaerolineaceae bacterium]|nr:ComEA family DNA-binding protein [Anaerolineaceae bacterium]MDE0328389.1 ComEA family DNA-binding protein [Anaerolineaceae bacterium]
MPDPHDRPPDHDRPQLRRVLFAIALLLLIVASALSLWQQTRPEPLQIRVVPPPPTWTPPPSPTPGPLKVYVSGAVHEPQVLSLPPGSRVLDAIASAGGPLPSADLDRVNLAEELRDGMQVHVAHHGTSPPTLATGDPRIDINRATLEELQGLPGVGPVLAQRIIAWREAQGSFSTLADLDAVTGVGPSLLRQLKGLLRFD